jgi:hypothetical protein
MNYELAKQLKDAGYPQGDTVLIGGEYTHNPTLEELIEACGDNTPYEITFMGIDKHWRVTRQDLYIWLMGKTPTEAVARLYLALNQHDKN